MVGVVTRNEPELSWSEFDRAFYEVKSVSGRAHEPVAAGINTLSCFADNAAVAERPDLVPVARDGARATRERPQFDWSYVCPSRTEYREGLLEMIEEAGEVSGDVRLDDVGFPRGEYCHCDVCDDAFAASDHDDRQAWRASVIEGFLAAARERVPGRLFLTLYPDPYPGHLYERSGIDVESIGSYVDEFVVPLYDTAYGTTYWLEALASGFADALPEPFTVELYAVDVDLDALVKATDVAAAYADDVCYGYDASTARAAIRRRDADGRDGVTHRPDGG
jgi:hypothetical protein